MINVYFDDWPSHYRTSMVGLDTDRKRDNEIRGFQYVFFLLGLFCLIDKLSLVYTMCHPCNAKKDFTKHLQICELPNKSSFFVVCNNT